MDVQKTVMKKLTKYSVGPYFARIIRSSEKPTMNHLKTVGSFGYPLSVLGDIGEEEDLDVVYTFLDKSIDDRFVVQVSINSRMNYIGIGENKLSAMENAATNVLMHMIRLLRKKSTAYGQTRFNVTPLKI